MASSVASQGGAQSLKERQRQEREQLILQAAEELLVERGYHETSIDEIAARVGVSKGTIYLHFQSKDDLILALFERNQRLFKQAIGTQLMGMNDPRATLESLLTYLYTGMYGKHFQALRAIFFQSPELRARLAERSGAHHEGWTELAERVGQILDAGKRNGQFDPTMPTPVMVAMYTNLLHPMSYARLLEDEQMEPAEIVEQICRFYFKGIAAESPSTTTTTAAQAPAGSAQ